MSRSREVFEYWPACLTNCFLLQGHVSAGATAYARAGRHRDDTLGKLGLEIQLFRRLAATGNWRESHRSRVQTTIDYRNL